VLRGPCPVGGPHPLVLQFWRKSLERERLGRGKPIENRGEVKARAAEAARMDPARRHPERVIRDARKPSVTKGRSVTAEAEGPPAMAGQDRVAPRALVP